MALTIVSDLCLIILWVMSMIFPAVYASCNDYHSEFSLTDDYSRNIIPEKQLLVTDITLLYNIVEVRFLSNVQHHTTNKNVIFMELQFS